MRSATNARCGTFVQAGLWLIQQIRPACRGVDKQVSVARGVETDRRFVWCIDEAHAFVDATLPAAVENVAVKIGRANAALVVKPVDLFV